MADASLTKNRLGASLLGMAAVVIGSFKRICRLPAAWCCRFCRFCPEREGRVCMRSEGFFHEREIFRCWEVFTPVWHRCVGQDHVPWEEQLPRGTDFIVRADLLLWRSRDGQACCHLCGHWVGVGSRPKVLDEPLNRPHVNRSVLQFRVAISGEETDSLCGKPCTAGLSAGLCALNA